MNVLSTWSQGRAVFRPSETLPLLKPRLTFTLHLPTTIRRLNSLIHTCGFSDPSARLPAPYFSAPSRGTQTAASSEYASARNASLYETVSASSKRQASSAACGVEAAVVDGTNLMLLSRGDSGFGIPHADAFTTWLMALQRLTSCKELYVVFDNKRSSGHVPDARRAFVATYLDARHAKLRRKQQHQKHQNQKHQNQQTPPNGRDASNALAPVTPGINGDELPTPQRQGRRQQQQQQEEVVYDMDKLRRSSEALMDRPPPHLVPFARAVRQLGGLTLYGMPGHEADDMIASLVAGLLSETKTCSGATNGSVTVAEGSATAASAAGASTTSTGSSTAAAATTTATAGTGGVAAMVGVTRHRVVVISADSDMLQLLAHPGCAWLEVRQLSTATSSQEDSPLALRTTFLPGIPEATMRLHEAAAQPCVDIARNEVGECALANRESDGGAAAATTAMPPSQRPAMQVLPPSAYPDYLALVGKAEAGVGGVGIGARAARRLLARYGSIDGIVRAYEAGALDDTLRPLASGGARGGPEARGQISAPTASSSFRSLDEQPYPSAVRQAVRNLRVTRMQEYVDAVPWERVRTYQLQRRSHPSDSKDWLTLANSTAAAAIAAAAAPAVPAGGGGSDGAEPVRPGPQATLHPQDQLHALSAEPFCTALSAALARRGLVCRTSVLDEQGWLVDITVCHLASPEAAHVTSFVEKTRAGDPSTWSSRVGSRMEETKNNRTAKGVAAAASAALPLSVDGIEAVADALEALARQQQQQQRQRKPQEQEHQQQEKTRGEACDPELPAGPQQPTMAARRAHSPLSQHSGCINEDGLTRATVGRSPASHSGRFYGSCSNDSSGSGLCSSSSTVTADAGSTGSPSYDGRRRGMGASVTLGGDGSRQGSAAGYSCSGGGDGDGDGSAASVSRMAEVTPVAPTAELQPLVGGDGMAIPLLRVCVLSPWDFEDPTSRRDQRRPAGMGGRKPLPVGQPAEQQDREPVSPPLQQQQNQSQKQHPKPNKQEQVSGVNAAAAPAAAPAAGPASKSTGAGAAEPGTQVARLLDLAVWLQAEVGPRASLAHTPRPLQAALRSTTGWRLKKLQRSAAAIAGSVAVVPFYDLLQLDGKTDTEGARDEGAVRA